LLPFILTGYASVRYFAAFFVVVALFMIWKSARIPLWAAVLAVLVVSMGIMHSVRQQKQGGMPHPSDADIMECLASAPQGLAVFGEATTAARLSALYGVRTGFLPKNLSQKEHDIAAESAFVKAYEVSVFVGPLMTNPPLSVIGGLYRCPNPGKGF